MTVSREEVIFAYRLLLNRLPESEAVITEHMRADSLRALLADFLRSAEFQNNPPTPIDRRLPLELPALEIDTDATDADTASCLAEIRKTWTQLGIDRPHFSVLTDPRFLPENISGSLDQFWQTGQLEAASVANIAKRHGKGDPANQTCVEFGCGVGRVTIDLARRYATVHAYDISATHLAHARRRAQEVGVTNIVFHNCANDPLARLAPCDLYYSAIVFQHNPPVVISRLIRGALQTLKPSGIALFQVPTYQLGYRFRTTEWLATTHAPDMQMHCFPQERIFEIISEENCAVMEVREDHWAGPATQRLSNTFVVRKGSAPTNDALRAAVGVTPSPEPAPPPRS
jgi:SAM-dependent methyltransferase